MLNQLQARIFRRVLTMGKQARHSGSLRKRLISSLFSLFGLQLATLLLPTILLPFLARRLGPGAWGLLAMYTSLGGIMVILLEFGFGYGATREFAANRDNGSLVADVVADVLGARLVLAVGVCGVWVAVWFLVPVVQGASSAYWWTLALTLVQGASFAWYFQAVGRLPYVATREIVARLVSTGLILLWVHEPAESGRVPALQFATILIAFLWSVHEMYRSVARRIPRPRRALRMLKSNRYLSGLRLVQSLTSMGNTFLMGALVPSALASYGAAERASNASRSMAIPVTQVAFPEFVAVARHDRIRARTYLRRILLIMTVAGTVGAIALWFVADYVVLILFSDQYSGAADVLRVLGLTLPLFAVCQTLGSQWMLAVGHDRAYFIAVSGGFAVNVALALMWVRTTGALGMAYSFAVSEMTVAVALVIYVELLGPPETRILRSPGRTASTDSVSNSPTAEGGG